MSGKSYGRRLTFLNAYITLALSFAGVAWAIYVVLSAPVPAKGLSWLPYTWVGLIRYLMRSAFDIYELRSGAEKADRWGWPFSWMTARWGVTLCALILAGFAVLVTVTTPVNPRKFDWLLMMFVAPPWAAIYLERAVWEWRNHYGRVPVEEIAEIDPEKPTTVVVPTTEPEIRKAIKKSRAILRYGPVCVALLFGLPGLILLTRQAWLFGGMTLLMGVAVTMMGWEGARKSLKTEIKACEAALNRLRNLSPMPVSLVAEPEVTRQELRGS